MTLLIKVISEVIEVTLDDQGKAWDTKNIPKHRVIIMLKFFNANQKNFQKKFESILNKRKLISKMNHLLLKKF